MKKVYLLTYSLILSVWLWGQTYQIGHRQVTYTDPARNNRQIQTEIYYPANTAGDNVAVANGQFPFIVFGHGFVMSWDSYKWMWDSLVPLGYILAFPRTEGSMSPSHSEFGKDLRFLNEKIKAEGNNASSFLYQKVAQKSAIMGHSMGGGASFLAADNYTNFTTLINFAAANTNPSAITAASRVTVPVLMFCGENDGVTPPQQHQIPMYDSCISSCKTRITIKGGGHCYFANYNFNCNFGEMTTSPQPTITREEQIARVNYLLVPYLNYMLKGNTSAGTTFLNRLTNNNNITYVRNCTTTLPEQNFRLNPLLYPNPIKNQFNIIMPQETNNVQIVIYDILGKTIFREIRSGQIITVNLNESTPSGIYFVQLSAGNEQHTLKIIKQ
ncbi:MAG: T9SS type A sorting domain-containing protein [Bacteroidales bacterium]|nr:T9SS type A sorting domain-containing protein [Bacteroidales bacterium]